MDTRTVAYIMPDTRCDIIQDLRGFKIIINVFSYLKTDGFLLKWRFIKHQIDIDKRQ